MKNSIVLSYDKFLLARLATDLQLSGVKHRENYFCPFDTIIWYLHVEHDSTFSFHSHGMCWITLPDDRHELTEENYINVLTHILNP